MRFILYVTVLLAIVPFVLTRPFFGLCAYYVVSILQPKFLCWRPEFQDAMIVGVPLVVGAILIGVRRVRLEPKISQRSGRIVGTTTRLVRGALFEPSWQVFLCAALIAYLVVNRVLSPFPMAETSVQFRSLCKVILVTTLLTGLASDYRRLRILIIVVGLSAAFWAIKGGIKVVLLGPHQVYGKTYDNNLFALTSVMSLPIVFYYALSVKHTRWRAVLLAFAALIILAIIGSRSRAGFVAMVVVVCCMAWISRYRVRAMFAVGIVGCATLLMAGDSIRERVQSILEYRQDKSAFSRFETWDYAQVLLSEFPITGVGFNHFERARQQYIGGAKAAHNIYLQNLAELGLIGHPLWLMLILGSIVSLLRLMRWSRRLPAEFRWAYYWSRGLLLALVAFCVHGTFHNEEYFELMFSIIGLNVALWVATVRAVREYQIRSAANVIARRQDKRKKARRDARKGRGNQISPAGFGGIGWKPGSAF